MKFVARALRHNSTLTALDFSFTPMGNKGLRILCDGLKHNRSISFINLQKIGISYEGAKDIYSVLESNHSITTVNLSNNKLVNLPKGFAFLTHITTLDLSDNPNLRFPQSFFADFRCGRVKVIFLLGFHKRVGHFSSIQLYFYNSSIFEPALLHCIFELIHTHALVSADGYEY